MHFFSNCKENTHSQFIYRVTFLRRAQFQSKYIQNDAFFKFIQGKLPIGHVFQLRPSENRQKKLSKYHGNSKNGIKNAIHNQNILKKQCKIVN